jgi:hypothetical protein
MWDEYYPNGSFSVPFTILAFHEQDLVCQAFQSDEEDWISGSLETALSKVPRRHAHVLRSAVPAQCCGMIRNRSRRPR